MENKTIYIHYGAKEYSPNINFPIKNRPDWPKPLGGLWASRETASYGWIHWTQEEHWGVLSKKNSFSFVLLDESKRYIISSRNDILQLPRIGDKREYGWYTIDFEKCLEMGIDAIELCWYGNEFKTIKKDDLYFDLYGWDCDSIVVLNPKSVIQI